MKTWGVMQFELAYQLRRYTTWVYMLALLGLAFWMSVGFVDDARRGGIYFNAPIIIGSVTIIASLMDLLVSAAIAADAATRDAQTRMAPLLYTAPQTRFAYLVGRFGAAFVLNSMCLVAVPVALWVATHVLGLERALIGPFEPMAYLGPFVVIALPNAFISTALLFVAAVLSRRPVVSYLVAVLLFLLVLFSREFVADIMGYWTLGKHLDPTGFTALSALWRAWTPLQKNTQLIALEGAMLTNRLLWLGVGLLALAVAHLRFRFAHHSVGGRRARVAGTTPALGTAPAAEQPWSVPVALPRVPRAFGRAAQLRQVGRVALHSFRAIAGNKSWLVFPAVFVLMQLMGPELLEGELGTPSLPVTGRLAAMSGHFAIGVFVVGLVTVYAGELVWRERDAGLGAITDATPVPVWVLFVGKLLGLWLMLLALQAVIMLSGIALQAQQDYFTFELGLYLQILFGLHLANYLLFAAVALAGHALVQAKYVGHLLVFLFYLCTVFAADLGLEHQLLVFGSDLGWRYTDMNGFGSALGAWGWYKLYWAGWALLIGLAGLVAWPHGQAPPPLRARLQQAAQRGRRLPWVLPALGVGLVLGAGGYIFYHTYVQQAYVSGAAQTAQRATYERRYGRFRNAPQPVLLATKLRVELYPERQAADVQGSYQLRNSTSRAIDSVHVVFHPEVAPGKVQFGQPAKLALSDDELGYRIYVLRTALQPGDTLRMHFRQALAPRGFAARGASSVVVANGTCLEESWLPSVGYQPAHELSNAGVRRQHGLASRPATRALEDSAARHDVRGREHIALETVVGTTPEQTAVAPGALLRTWQAGGRRYFHYRTDAPIRNGYAVFSARYALKETRWRNVQIQVLHHPGHTQNLGRLLRSVEASLAYCTKQFGPYPHQQLRLIEVPSAASGLRLTSFPGTIRYTEGFAFVNPQRDDRDLDLPFAVMAHEVAHQWWGNQVVPAMVEGGPVLSESLAWYSAMGVVEGTLGAEHLGRLLRMMRREYISPRPEADVPLLRETDHFGVYRKGPFAMYALREYLGPAPVNAALQRLFKQYRGGQAPLPTSLHLYRELQTATPDSLRYLLHDLFAQNTFWELAAERVEAKPLTGGKWQVSIGVRARKLSVSQTGTEKQLPMHDVVEIGAYAPAPGDLRGEQLYLGKHRIQAGRQTITITVPRKPAQAGIDPRHLLIDGNLDDNLRALAPGK
ncbi:ABC transporter permease [Hymenobacter oligotrophus]|uniref:ABC transporter permease n=1 Tax=Hymenobacter oligotrophus TaxID=2319843 RepID=A0A3B7R8X8_9BACT|nr:M1 family aminopeptidase [Hymenobacter oligotrophus]AYA37581.1 ABC transporter permease [Hymenobacter oligotrophus]